MKLQSDADVILVIARDDLPAVIAKSLQAHFYFLS